MPEIFADVGHCVDAVLRRVGSRVVLALPLGIGKPNPVSYTHLTLPTKA